MDKNYTENLKNFITQCLEEKKAQEIDCFKLPDESVIGSYMIIANGRSSKNIRAIAEYISMELKKSLKERVFIEGGDDSQWLLLDAGEIVVHLLHPEARKRLNIEELFRSHKI